MDNLDEYVAFAVGENGEAYRLLQGSRSIVAYKNIAWWDTSAFHLTLQIAVIAIFISILRESNRL
jgi:hypothetical protein